MDFRILGPLEVEDDGRTVDLGTAKQRSLLALLLTDANHVVSTDRILDELWGDDADGKERSLWPGLANVWVFRIILRETRALLQRPIWDSTRS